MNDDSYSLSESTCSQRSMLGFNLSERLGKASSMGIRSARMLGKSIIHEDSVSPDT